MKRTQKGTTASLGKRKKAQMARRKSMRPGGGGRFKKLVGKLRRKGVRNPRALAAYIGRKKYGSKRFASMAARGRRRRK